MLYHKTWSPKTRVSIYWNLFKFRLIKLILNGENSLSLNSSLFKHFLPTFRLVRWGRSFLCHSQETCLNQVLFHSRIRTSWSSGLRTLAALPTPTPLRLSSMSRMLMTTAQGSPVPTTTKVSLRMSLRVTQSCKSLPLTLIRYGCCRPKYFYIIFLKAIYKWRHENLILPVNTMERGASF